MKKIILSLVGVVGLTAVSWGQLLNTGAFPQTFNPGGLVLNTTSKGTVNFANTSLQKASVSDYGPGYQYVTYNLTGSSAYNAGEEHIQMSIGSNGSEVSVRVTGFRYLGPDDPGYSPGKSEEYYVMTWVGPNLSSLTPFTLYPANYSGIVAPAPSFNTAWMGGVSTDGKSFLGGAYVPPTEPDGGGTGGVIGSAIELNKGLTFENGQWTPTQQ